MKDICVIIGQRSLLQNCHYNTQSLWVAAAAEARKRAEGFFPFLQNNWFFFSGNSNVSYDKWKSSNMPYVVFGHLYWYKTVGM